MTNLELLELAAKADGRKTERIAGKLWIEKCTTEWNPLTDDGDALRLAVKLGLAVMPYPLFEAPKHAIVVSQRKFEHSRYEACELYEETDPYAATRRAIVRAAAEIGKEMK